MTNIPTEIFYHHIFLRLPIRSLLRFRCVCKTWYSLLQDRDFFLRHFNRLRQQQSRKLILNFGNQFYSVRFDASNNSYGTVDVVKTPYLLRSLVCPLLEIVDSCNGLLCIAVERGPWYDDTDILIWNPSTGDSKLLPNPWPPVQFHKHPVGFAYDSSEDDYRILRYDGLDFQVYTYTLRNNSWKCIGNAPSFAIGMSKTECFMDGCIFWQQLHILRGGRKIVCFDLEEKTFNELELPQELQQGEVTDLRVLGEYLGMVQLSDTMYQVWIMNNRKEWRKIISMHFEQVEFWVSCSRPLYITKNGEVVILARFNGSDQKKFLIYNPKSNSMEEFPIHGFDGINICKEITYIESFVSPNLE